MNPRLFRFLVLSLLLIGVVVTGVYAVEADKEVRILCGLFKPGTSEREMDRILGTASFLDVVETRESGQTVRVVHSRWNLGRNGCRVVLADGALVSRQDWDAFDRLGSD
ncbi:MAG: hypothetical protein V2I57_15100 [Xanthomonadales bacterium]|jgi:hypothetical protein|nr:hypothetical protein [Xanthomonadales bacterium]